MSPGVSPWGTSQEVTAAAWVSPWHRGGGGVSLWGPQGVLGVSPGMP